MSKLKILFSFLILFGVMAIAVNLAATSGAETKAVKKETAAAPAVKHDAAADADIKKSAEAAEKVVEAAAVCTPAEPSLRFGTPEWTKSHNAIISSGAETNCTQRECFGCHISSAPHPAGMQGRHITEYKNNKESCLKCHDYDSCNECHQAIWSHAPDRTFDNHPDFLKDTTAAACMGCHLKEDQKFCNDCHKEEEKAKVLKDHDENFDRTHPMFVMNKMEPCGECHTEHYCVNCHEGKKVHPLKWERGHADRIDQIIAGQEEKEFDRCINCHSAEYCQKCHKKEGLLSSNHVEGWKDNHGDKPESATYICATCHTDNYCSECHEISLPHDAKFDENHKQQAETMPDTCVSCHKPDYCMTCHSHIDSKDHTSNLNWYREHKDIAKAERKPALDQEGLKKRTDRLAAAKKKNKTPPQPKYYCNTCHDEKTYCGMCHETSTSKSSHKNPKEWEEEHQKTKNLKELEGCAHCHKMSYCADKCHTDNEKKQIEEVEAQKKLDPATIKEEDKKEKNHVLCTQCHADLNWTFKGLESCADVDCHKDISRDNSLAIHMSDCLTCHTPHEWTLKEKAVCSNCHKEKVADKITVKEHMEKVNCGDCHKTHEWASTRRFAVCEECHRKEGESKVSKLHQVKAHGRCGTCHDQHTTKVAAPEKCQNCHRKLPVTCTENPKKSCYDSKCHDFWDPENKLKKQQKLKAAK